MTTRDEVSPNGSNGSSPNNNVDTDIRTLEIDGEQFDFRETDDSIDIIVPDDMPEEKRTKIEKKAEEFKHTLASAKRKAMEANREREDLRREREELELERDRLRKEKESLHSLRGSNVTNDNAILKAFGVETWDEVSQLQVENPEGYHRGLARYNAEIAAQDAYIRLRNESLSNIIMDEGYNPSTIAAFAKAKGIANLDVAFDYYKRVSEKPKGFSLADIQKKAVKIVPKGAVEPKESKKAIGLRELYKEIND